MKNLFRIISSTIMMLALSFTLHAQNLPEAGNIGLRASILGQSTIEVPYMLNESVSLAPAIGFSTTEDISSNFQIGVRPRFYMQTTGSVVSYISGNLEVDISKNKVSDTSSTDILLGGGYGGEYFFSNNFSLSAEALLNLRTGDSPTNFATGARISASVYF